jgi:hypothetical protein
VLSVWAWDNCWSAQAFLLVRSGGSAVVSLARRAVEGVVRWCCATTEVMVFARIINWINWTAQNSAPLMGHGLFGDVADSLPAQENARWRVLAVCRYQARTIIRTRSGRTTAAT